MLAFLTGPPNFGRGRVFHKESPNKKQQQSEPVDNSGMIMMDPMFPDLNPYTFSMPAVAQMQADTRAATQKKPAQPEEEVVRLAIWKLVQHRSQTMLALKPLQVSDGHVCLGRSRWISRRGSSMRKRRRRQHRWGCASTCTRYRARRWACTAWTLWPSAAAARSTYTPLWKTPPSPRWAARLEAHGCQPTSKIVPRLFSQYPVICPKASRWKRRWARHECWAIMLERWR